MAPVARRMQRGSGFGQMVPEDARIADLLVAERELAVGESDGARVVRELRVLERPCMQRDRARLFAPRKRQPAVQAPQPRQAGVADWFADRGWAAESGSGLREVVLQQPGFRQRRANGDFVLAGERSRAKGGAKHFGGLGAASPFESGVPPGDR